MPIWMRVLSILLTTAAIVVWIWLAFRHRRHRLYAVPPLLWLVNLLIFSLAAYGRAVGFCSIDVRLLNVWAASISILAVVMVLGIGIVWFKWGTPYDDIR